MRNVVVVVLLVLVIPLVKYGQNLNIVFVEAVAVVVKGMVNYVVVVVVVALEVVHVW